jgi:uncharacterized SAM-binding protein YcdF (DUF218 family)
MHCALRCVGVLAVVLVLAASLAVLAGREASGWLSASDPPARAAAIVVLGDDPVRALGGADLYREGIAPRVLLSVPLRAPRLALLEREGEPVAWFEESAARLLHRHGVPEAAIGTFGRALKSTYAEGLALAEQFPPGATLVVVTSPYHVRRTRMILRDALPGRDVRVVGNRHETLPAAWWTEQEATRNVLLEGIKLAYYVAGGRFR